MKILFLFAHPDDEAYGPAGTIAKLAQEHEVTVAVMCKGDRPGNESVAEERSSAFVRSCQLLGATPILGSFSDCRLEYVTTLSTIESVVAVIDPDMVYTHNISDIHKDHRLVAECAMVACRPKAGNNLRGLFMCELPASTAWAFNQIAPSFEPNVYFDVTEYMDLKEQSLQMYGTETYEAPDFRSLHGMQSLAQYRGTQIGVKYAEAFKLILSKN